MRHYHNKTSQPNADSLCLQDGIAPQIKVFGIDGLTAPTKDGRAFIPPGVTKGFKKSHSISNYGWIFNKGINDAGYVKKRK